MRSSTRRARLLVIIVGLVVLIPKLLIASRTYGTEDIHTWTDFAQGVARRGPVGIYEIDFRQLTGGLYNHPPLMGYYLEVVNKLAQWGVPLRVTIRAVSSVADMVSGLLVFEILRRRQSLEQSTLAAALITASPILFLISGYHGNTDPVFMMLVLLGCFLVLDGRTVLFGGAALALALGVKIVPIVILPVIAVYLLRHRRDLILRAAAGFLITLAVTWGPALVLEWNALKQNVLGYSGISERPWGLVRFANYLGLPWAADFMAGPGKNALVLACALAPAILVWQRAILVMESVALSLVAFLVFSPAFGVQYLAWAVAAACLLDVWSASFYSVLGGILLFQIYDRWNHGLPWSKMAPGLRFTPYETALGALVWLSLVVVLARGTWLAVRRGRAGIQSDVVFEAAAVAR